MPSDIPVLTEKGHAAIKNPSVPLTARCRSVLVQVDGKRSVEDIRTMLRGLEGLDEAIARLLREGYVATRASCRDQVRAIAVKQLGPAKAATILRKIEELAARYGDSCWEHMDELDKAARLFYGVTAAEQLKAEILTVIPPPSKHS
jgi:hypothetical protein